MFSFWHPRWVVRPRTWCAGWHFCAAVALTAVWLMPGVLRAARVPGEPINEFGTGYSTPHVPWAKPYARGRIRAFFIAPFTAAREVTELAQRLDVELHGETTMSEKNLGATDPYTRRVTGTSPDEKKQALLQKLSEPYDVIVLANFAFDSLPTQVQFVIVKQVTEGAGLVLIYKREVRPELLRHPVPEAARDIRSGIPFAGLDFYRVHGPTELKVPAAEAGRKVVSAYRAKKGRIVQLDFGIQSDARTGGFCLTPREFFTFRSQCQYEYHQMLVINAMLWAAGKEPLVRVASPTWCAAPIEQSALPGTQQIVLTNRSTPMRAKLTLAIRNPWGEEEWSDVKDVELAAGESAFALALPHLSGGGHYLDVRLVGAAGALGWGSFWFQVEPPVRIAELKMDRLSFERTEPATGVVRLKGPRLGRDWRLRIEIRDNYERLYAITQVPVPGGAAEVRFGVSLANAVSIAGRCRAKLLRAGRLIDRTEAEFFVPKRRLDVFPTLLWGTLPGILGHFLNNKIRSVGFNAILLPHYVVDNREDGEHRRIAAVSRDDMLAVPYVTHIAYWSGAYGDEAAYASRRPAMVKVAEWLKPYGPLIYSLGDENSIVDRMGFDEGDRPAWIRYLKRSYGTLEELNRSWGTSLGTWQEARPVRRQEAAESKSYARYHDTESYREELYARWHRWHHDLYKTVDPHARVGAEGSQPGDLEKTIRGLEFWGPYRNRVINTLERSLAPRSVIRGNWFGGYVSRRHDLAGLRRFLWDTFLDGSNLFEIYCCYTAENIFNTDLTMGYWAEAFLPDLEEIVDGIGQLAAVSEHETDPVAVHHSQPSVHACRVHGPFGGEHFRNADHRSALTLLEDAGFQPCYVTSAQVEAGLLDSPSAPKVLLLPYDQAISDKEAAILKRYVERGGILIADVCPGIMDGHCALRQRGALDELFGVRRDESLAAAAPAGLTLPPAEVRTGSGSVSLPAVSMSEAQVDKAVTLAGGEAKGRAGQWPAIVLRRHGSGLAVLLNVALAGYEKRHPPERAALRDLVGGLVSLSGLKPFCRAFAQDGQPLPGCRLPRFRRGRVRTLMVLPSRAEGDEKRNAVLRLSSAAHVYDQRSGTYFGRVAEVKLQLDPTSATVLALLPYAVQGVRVSGDDTVEPGGAASLTVSLQTSGPGSPEGHVFRVKLFRPDGEELWHCARTLRPASDAVSEATVRLPFAYNDPPGQWTALVRDVATRSETRFSIRLGAPQTPP